MRSLVALLFCSVSALLYAQAAPPDGFPTFLESKVVRANSDGSDESAAWVQGQIFFLPGLIFGGGPTDVELPLHSGERPDIVYPLYLLKPFAKDFAKPLDTTALWNENVTVSPETVKILRIGTLAIEQATDKVLSAGFSKDSKKSDRVLMYFDAPVRIKGLLEAGGEAFSIEVKIDDAGFHWLVVEEDRVSLEVDPSIRPVFLVDE